MFKKIRIFIMFSLLFFVQSVSANQLDFYWEKDSSWDLISEKNIEIINESLNNFYKSTWLNTDIVVLWKWDVCYLKPNFDSCIQNTYNYSSDLIIAMSMKSDVKSKWDIRSLIKDDYKELLRPNDLIYMQDMIIPFFKNSDYTWWLKEYLSLIEWNIEEWCKKVSLPGSCNIIELAREYHNYVAELEYQKKYNTMMKIIYNIVFCLFLIVTYFLFKNFYIRWINNLFKDVKYKLLNIWDYWLFEKDRRKLISELEILEKTIKNKLWDLDKNTFHLRKTYKQFKKSLSLIETSFFENEKSFAKKDELKEKVEEMKKIDL